MSAPGPVFATESGPVQCVHLNDVEVHHVGYATAPWDWADWEYAKSGRFQGRWDDPNGHWRAKYVGADPVACYLEVLAPFRPDPALLSSMDAIESNDEDDDTYPTVARGILDRSWCDNRLFCTAQLTGDFALPSNRETLSTLREEFLAVARGLDIQDVDAAAIRMSTPRELTQAISAWLYEIVGPDGERVNGVQYLSRHGDELVLWAIYERGEGDSPPEITSRFKPVKISPDDPHLAEAMRIHRIEWIGP